MAKAKRDGLFRRGSIWWVRTDPIEKKAKSTECRDLEAARQWRAERERQAANPAHHAASRATLGECCDDLIAALESLGKATDFHEQKLGHWVRIFGYDEKLAGLGPVAFDRLVTTRRTEGASDHTINKELGCMLRALKLAKRKGLYAGDLSVLRPMGFSRGYVPRTRALEPAELAALLGKLAPRRHPFVALCVGLGLRRGELLRLLPEHVDLSTWEVAVPGTKTAGARRRIPVLPPFRRLVETAAQSLPVEPWGNYLRDLKVACKHAGIPPVTANDLRRTHATLLRSAAVDADTARLLLGHAPKSTMLELVYDKPTPAQLAARAGDMASLVLPLLGTGVTITRHCAGSDAGASCVSLDDSQGKASAPADERQGLRSRRSKVRILPGAQDSPVIRTPGDAGGRRGTPATVTTTRHSPAAWLLAAAAGRMGVLPERRVS
jgi:integrase